ncbi:hypothetical protein GP486_004791 [Trichoglossum hirsutum]|uniref:N-acetyltransferase domain-containing protein n=1 Tax=Trichoglossum hirsutum TaxID=265104 RepID=A0A9P8LAM2_9PEZI|nr:hypothetical protein GP486_004791 [Trichoglossum hirsutum]
MFNVLLSSGLEDPFHKFTFDLRDDDPVGYERYWNSVLSYFVKDYRAWVVSDQGEIISFGVWYRTASQLPKFDRGGASVERFKACQDVLNRINSYYENDRLQLELLYTKKDNWKKGAASLILEQFMKEALGRGISAVVAASPMGEKLYKKKGFVVDKEWKVADGEEKVTFHTLKKE